MACYLLTWKDWEWKDLEQVIETTKAGSPYTMDWRVHAHRQIKPGDRVFLLKQGKPSGIMGIGRVVGKPAPFTPPDAEYQRYRASIEIERLLPPKEGFLLPLDDLPSTIYWRTQASGISIDDKDAAQLFEAWSNWLAGLSTEHPEDAKSGDWSKEEVAATVADYFQMLDLELRGEQFSKARHRRYLLTQLSGRSAPAIEFKHCNISAFLDEKGLPFIKGYKPRSNYQALLADEIERFLAIHSDVMNSLEVVSPLLDFSTSDWQQVEESAPDIARTSQTPSLKVGRIIDWATRDAVNRQLGMTGELFVMEFEVNRLKAIGRDDLARRVTHTSATCGDGLGYDIESFDQSGNAVFIEVKATNGCKTSPFLISANEIWCSERHGTSYWLYRVFNLNRDPKLYRISGPLSATLALEPATFRAFPISG